ncbi:MAG TPA: magnesium transporter [Jiangellaceae bacterium]
MTPTTNIAGRAMATSVAIAHAASSARARFGQDPAFGSGPLATVIQDLLTLLIYIVIASALVTS